MLELAYGTHHVTSSNKLSLDENNGVFGIRILKTDKTIQKKANVFLIFLMGKVYDVLEA